MTLEELGFTESLATYQKEQHLDSFLVGRVISEHKERYLVRTADSEYDSEIIGNLRFTANSRANFPAVGDWVAISPFNEKDALIHAVFPRKTIIERKAVGKHGEKQIIATNIDYAFIVQAVDRDFNINRIERYLSICYASKVIPMIILNKIDLIEDSDLQSLVAKVRNRIPDVQLFTISNESLHGIEMIKKVIQKGKTYCLLGSSGVGKSSLSNILSGKQSMKTDAISTSTNRGKHVTSHRELLILENGGILIDNPGMREVGLTDTREGLDQTFEQIITLAKECKFKDCTHTSELGCRVLKAVEKGELNQSAYENYLKMEREKAHFESTVVEKRKRDKHFGKMMKNYKKDQNKFK
ncbi:ribosome small subunit-dependent GTPase A [Algoriphagus lutimaris]|uniref:ribosome small subunit-dependent GTPase A n=1 Tax=Algoriphagus lutimaris TaxID=613197 RepID=UPI00196B202D|nr:ribosome small subunit-dependent GTPase A [Algoriphagus lutimaris]MBN3519729.1 ribosome small subunit-dependent GTPase A [Algoriphagus lutimaris]